MSDIYPDKHEALSIAGQLKPSEKLRTLSAILSEEETSGRTQARNKSRSIDKRDSLFIVKYASLGRNKPIHAVVKKLRNDFKLKWLRPRVVYSRQTNLQEKLLGDLLRKLASSRKLRRW
jgi:hypothetical protein